MFSYTVLAEKNVGGYTRRVIDAPHEISDYKNRIGSIKPFSSSYTESEIEQRKAAPAQVECFGMSEHRVVSTKESKILLTDGISDCVGIAVYDSTREKAGLFHFSKNNHGFDLVDFFNQFDAAATIHLISAYYSSELAAVVDYLKNQRFLIAGLNVNNACKSVHFGLGCDTCVDKNDVPEAYLRGDRIDVCLLLEVATGRIGFMHVETAQSVLQESSSSISSPLIFSKPFKPFSNRTLLEKGLSHNFNIVKGYSVRIDPIFMDTSKQSFDINNDDFRMTISGKNILSFTFAKQQEMVSGYFATAETDLVARLKSAFPSEQQGQYQMYRGSINVELRSLDDFKQVCSLIPDFPAALQKEIEEVLKSKSRTELK